PETTLAGADLWAYRDRITESVSRLGVIHKFDVLVPPHLVDSLAGELRSRLSPHRLFVFGHLLAHDIHLNVAPATPGAHLPGDVDDIVYDAVERVGGMAAGEHGVGRVKTDRVWASLREEQRRIVEEQNRRLDPDGRLNPGVGRRFD
ncbi:MAG: hypothetical protein GEU79_15135, partial [Acidimicrobiia bacterium]|nr:hypothetical protein [Acidimicrobiia bacterium]